MESINKFLTVAEVFQWFRGSFGFGEPFPLDNIVELTALNKGIKNLLNLPLLFSFNLDRSRRFWDTSRDVRRTIALKERYVKDRVNAKVRRDI